jgi:hypothetical protein
MSRARIKKNPNPHRILLYKYHKSIVLDQKNSSTYYYDKSRYRGIEIVLSRVNVRYALRNYIIIT